MFSLRKVIFTTPNPNTGLLSVASVFVRGLWVCCDLPFRKQWPDESWLIPLNRKSQIRTLTPDPFCWAGARSPWWLQILADNCSNWYISWDNCLNTDWSCHTQRSLSSKTVSSPRSQWMAKDWLIHSYDSAVLLSLGRKTSDYNLGSRVSYGVRLSLNFWNHLFV